MARHQLSTEDLTRQIQELQARLARAQAHQVIKDLIRDDDDERTLGDLLAEATSKNMYQQLTAMPLGELFRPQVEHTRAAGIPRKEKNNIVELLVNCIKEAHDAGKPNVSEHVLRDTLANAYPTAEVRSQQVAYYLKPFIADGRIVRTAGEKGMGGKAPTYAISKPKAKAKK